MCNEKQETTEEKTRSIVMTVFWTLLKIFMWVVIGYFALMAGLFMLAVM